MLLGFIFVGFQAYEYSHAYNDLNLKMSSGIYGSTFYMLTGFHGFHVTLGAIMLTVIPRLATSKANDLDIPTIPALEAA